MKVDKSVTSEDHVRDDQVVNERQRFNIGEGLYEDFLEISRSSLYTIVTIPRPLKTLSPLSSENTVVEPQNTVNDISCYDDETGSIVTGDEFGIRYGNPKTKQLSHTNSPNKRKKFKQPFNDRKVTVTVFRNQKDILLVDYMESETTVNPDVYC